MCVMLFVTDTSVSVHSGTALWTRLKQRCPEAKLKVKTNRKNYLSFSLNEPDTILWQMSFCQSFHRITVQYLLVFIILILLYGVKFSIGYALSKVLAYDVHVALSAKLPVCCNCKGCVLFSAPHLSWVGFCDCLVYRTL